MHRNIFRGNFVTLCLFYRLYLSRFYFNCAIYIALCQSSTKFMQEINNYAEMNYNDIALTMQDKAVSRKSPYITVHRIWASETV